MTFKEKLPSTETGFDYLWNVSKNGQYIGYRETEKVTVSSLLFIGKNSDIVINKIATPSGERKIKLCFLKPSTTEILNTYTVNPQSGFIETTGADTDKNLESFALDLLKYYDYDPTDPDTQVKIRKHIFEHIVEEVKKELK